jgi:hypothetical protein
MRSPLRTKEFVVKEMKVYDTLAKNICLAEISGD